MTDNFPKVPNPLDGIVITKQPKTPPIIRGRRNPIDEAAAAKLVTFDEMLAKSACVTKTRRPAKTDETPTCNETCNETPTCNETLPNAVAAVTKHGRPAKGGQPMTSAERVAAHRLRKRAGVMTWKPTLTQLETIAEMATARLSTAVMAAAVGLSPEAFIAWRRRSLAAVRAEEARHAKPEPIPPKPVVAVVSPRVVADRAFERAGEERRGAATFCSH